MAVRHPLRRSDYHPGSLREALSARLGRPVDLLTSRPSDDNPDGAVIAQDPATGEPIDLDPQLVAEVVAAHQPPPSSARQALADFDAATTPGAKLQAVRDWLAREVAREDQARQRRQAMIDAARRGGR